MAAPKGRALAEGCYMIIDPDGTTTPESSEIRALRMAVSTGAKVKFVKWGQAVNQGVDPSNPVAVKPKATTKKAEPKSEPITEEAEYDEYEADKAAEAQVAPPAVVEASAPADF
jgi:hypothetical protein